ncbi:MAG: UbiX family flavin prenyltransferase [Pseudomonadota bacterium]
MRRIIIGITGASGVIYGIRLLEVLREEPGIETHLVLSKLGKMNISIETDLTLKYVHSLANQVHNNQDVSATLASGSFTTDGMVVAPCSMKSLSSIVHSAADNLITRASDVILKEGRKLVLLPRETPLHLGHCRLLLSAAEMGARLVPPMPAFYNQPQSVDDIVNHTVGRVLDLFDIDAGIVKRWEGTKRS